MPERIQLRRTKGWRLPENTVVVSRPSKWGNPFRFKTTRGLARVPAVIGAGEWEYEGRVSAAGARHDYHHPDGRITTCNIRYLTRAEVVDLFRRVLTGVDPEPRRLAGSFITWRTLGFNAELARQELAGKNLACWCPLVDEFGQRVPCHADVLLEVANA